MKIKKTRRKILPKKISSSSKSNRKHSTKDFNKEIKEITRALSHLNRIAKSTPRIKTIVKVLKAERNKKKKEKIFPQQKQLVKKKKVSIPKSKPRHQKRITIVKQPRKKGKLKAPTALKISQRQKIKTTTTKGNKISRSWRFVKAIKENYANDPQIKALTIKQLRSEYKKFRQRQGSKVPDVAWYNPSP